MLKARFGAADAQTIKNARAYAYGGSVMPDMGYYPFGSHFFTNLLHYEKTGDFIETLLRDARDVDEYAFAIGALFVIAWFAGLLYLPRLFVYHAEATEPTVRERLKVMERRLLVMTHIGAMFTGVFGQ